MFLRGLLGVAIGWGLGGAAYGLLVSYRMDLAGSAGDSFVLMGYVALAFVLLGSLLYLLRGAIRALIGLVRPGQQPRPPTSLQAAVTASLGSFALVLAVLLAGGDFLLSLAFRADLSRTSLVFKDLGFLALGGLLCWTLAGPISRRVDGLLSRIRDPRGVHSLAGALVVLCGLALIGPLLGASSVDKRVPKSGAAPPGVQDTGLKVLLIGIDGANWSVIGPLIEQDRMPVLKRLAKEGVVATLHSPPPQVSPAIWTTIVTGTRPEVHGVKEYLLVSFPGLSAFPFEALAKDLMVVPFFFVGLSYYLTGVAEGIPPVSGQLRVPALWHRVDQIGARSLVLGWPCTWPAVKMAGLMVSDRFGPNEFDMFSSAGREVPDRIHPAGAEQRLKANILDSGGDPRPMLEALSDLTPAEMEELVGFTHNPMLPPPMKLLADVYDADLTYLGIFRAELARESYRLGLIMLNGIDLAMHVFWRQRFPEDFGLEESERPRWGRLIDAFHELTDRKLGEALKAAGDDTVVIVVSDHGMQAAPGNPVWPGWHAPQALLIISGGPIRRGFVTAQVDYLDIAPTVLYLLGYPVPENLPGRVLLDLIEEGFGHRHP